MSPPAISPSSLCSDSKPPWHRRRGWGESARVLAICIESCPDRSCMQQTFDARTASSATTYRVRAILLLGDAAQLCDLLLMYADVTLGRCNFFVNGTAHDSNTDSQDA